LIETRFDEPNGRVNIMSDAVTLAVGETAPDFEAVLTDGSKFVLSENLSSGKGVILYFYPRDNTPGCTTQACDFRDNFGRISNESWTVVGVSTDSAKSHQNFIAKHDLPFDLIVDEEAELHSLYGTWREKSMYGKTYMGTLRSTFAISPDGTLAWVGYKVKTKGHVDQVLQDLGIE
tara:strand:+ start:1162 stop:1689 length:528 start_codon:yes stop_codon:yes gene_type:complete